MLRPPPTVPSLTLHLLSLELTLRFVHISLFPLCVSSIHSILPSVPSPITITLFSFSVFAVAFLYLDQIESRTANVSRAGLDTIHFLTTLRLDCSHL